MAFIDIETTGLDANKHEILEIGMVLVDKKTRVVLSTAVYKVKPEHIENADQIALNVNGYSEEEWADAKPLKEALELIMQQARGATMIAYNISFDYSFLQAALSKTGVKDTLRYQRLDLLTIAWLLMPDAVSLSLKNVCKTLGIEPEPEVHTALNGAQKAFEVYSVLMNRSHMDGLAFIKNGTE